MSHLITDETMRNIFFYHPLTRSIIGAIQMAVSDRSISFEEQTILDEIKKLNENCILTGLFDRMGIPSNELNSTLSNYRSALCGKIQSQETIGLTFFIYGYFASARLWWTKAAEQGSKMAKFQLGVLYLSGKGIPVDIKQAEIIFKSLTFDSDDELKSKSYHNLGIIFSQTQQFDQMEHCFLEAAKMNNVSSIKNMGDIFYKRGEMEKAKEMYHRAHILGDSYSTFCLARFAKNQKEALKIMANAGKNGSWRATVYIVYQILLRQSIITDFRYVQDLLFQVYPKIPISHKVKFRVLSLICYLKIFGDGTDPDDDLGFILPHHLDEIMRGEFPSLPEPRTLEEDACWARDNLDFNKALTLFDKAAQNDGYNSPKVHLNLGMIYFHGFGNDNPKKCLYHFYRYIELTEPDHFHAHILTIIEQLTNS